nr:hypothetical protein CFP56_57827 [Quercus suber]
MPQETYSLLSLDEDVDEDRNASTRYAPLTNMLSAAHFVAALLVAQQDFSRNDHSINQPAAPSLCYAILGGFSMQLRGGRRSTRDIDFVTNIKMRGVWAAITGEDRCIIPDSRLIEGVLKIFVKTGGIWDACAEEHVIEVDIKQAGFRSSPRKLDEHTEVVGPIDFLGKSLYFNLLDIASMMRIKIECCLSRAEPRDFEDVRYMITSYALQVRQALEAGFLQADDLSEVLQHEELGSTSVRADLANILL